MCQYNLDLVSEEYTCGNCGKKFSAAYYRKSKYSGRTMTRWMPHAAAANFYRHLFSCYKKSKERA